MEKECYIVLYIAFGGGSIILFVFSLLAFLDIKGLHIEDGKNNSSITTTKDGKIFYSQINEQIQDKTNLFLTNNGIIPKIWTLLFSFNEDSEVLNYIIR